MKTKFKKGDKVTLTTNRTLECEGENWAKKAGIKIGKIYTVSQFDFGGWDDEKENSIELEGCRFSHPASKFKLVATHPLIITKQTKTRGTKKYYTWQMSKNKKITNHSYDTAAGRNKQLAQMIEDFQTGNFEIK